MKTPPTILGILNLTADSFSDGGRHLDVAAALGHATQMLACGASAIDVGAQASNPDAADVSPAVELARLAPIVERLKRDGCVVSADTYRPSVMQAMLDRGVDFINDIAGFESPESIAAVRDAPARLIVMHAVHTRAGVARAERVATSPDTILRRIDSFFDQRIAQLEAAGIDRRRLILDPGLGFFLGADPNVSLAVLRGLPRLRRFGLPILVSPSRKSFIGAALEPSGVPRPVHERAAGTLACELWAALHGADYIRTHEPRPLADALRIWRAMESAES